MYMASQPLVGMKESACMTAPKESKASSEATEEHLGLLLCTESWCSDASNTPATKQGVQARR
jgi:hypothetical protein